MRRIITIIIGSVFPMLTYSADIDTGRGKARACTACHGANGVSISDDIPNLAGQRIGYLTTQLKAFREGTRKNPLMSAMAGQLTDADIDNVAAFFSSLSAPGENEPSDTAKALSENRVTLPSNFRETFTRYSISDQAGPKRVRYNFLNESAVGGLDSRGMLPDKTTIVTEIYAAKLDDSGMPVTGEDGHFVPEKLLTHAVMEKRRGWGDTIPPELRNGDWNYAVFNADKTLKEGVNQAACLACHKPLHDADYLFSYQALVDRKQ
ncbi:MAG: cytochrome P460 family protein [Gammaproteobacteria bacterium]|nr:cytochrome P460 family protein [Gammaproteobacteria bacterium]